MEAFLFKIKVSTGKVKTDLLIHENLFQCVALAEGMEGGVYGGFKEKSSLIYMQPV